MMLNSMRTDIIVFHLMGYCSKYLECNDFQAISVWI